MYDLSHPKVPLFVEECDDLGRLHTIGKDGRNVIGSRYAGCFVDRIVKLERELIGLRRSLASLLADIPPEQLSLLARAQAAMALTPAPPPEQRSVQRRATASSPRGRRSASHPAVAPASPRPLFDLLNALAAHHVPKSATVPEPAPKVRPRLRKPKRDLK